MFLHVLHRTVLVAVRADAAAVLVATLVVLLVLLQLLLKLSAFSGYLLVSLLQHFNLILQVQHLLTQLTLSHFCLCHALKECLVGHFLVSKAVAEFFLTLLKVLHLQLERLVFLRKARVGLFYLPQLRLKLFTFRLQFNHLVNGDL